LKIENRKLKIGWEARKLLEACEIKPQKSEAKTRLKSNDKVSFVPMENLGINQKILIPKQERSLSEVEGSYTYFADDDVLLAKITPCFENGKLGIAKNLRNGIGFGSSEYIVFRTGNSLYNEFLYYFLSQEDFRINGAKSMSGAVGHKRVAKSFIEGTLIPIPPLPEQKRIVAILDSAFEKIAKAKENAEKNLQNARELFESYLQSVFANPGNGWEEKKLGDMCDFVRGPFGGSLKKSIFKPKGYAVYEQQHAIYDQFDDVRYFIDEKKFNEMKRFELNSGDLIMSCSGTMGKMAIVPEKIKKGIINQALLKLTPSKEISVVFLKLWMQSDNFQESLKAYSQGAAIQNVASVKILKEIKMPVPSMNEQKRIVAKLDALSAETKKLEAIYQQKLADLEELKKSILQKAFTGQLKMEN
jgi:type I restriction enzyme S subunit